MMISDKIAMILLNVFNVKPPKFNKNNADRISPAGVKCLVVIVVISVVRLVNRRYDFFVNFPFFSFLSLSLQAFPIAAIPLIGSDTANTIACNT